MGKNERAKEKNNYFLDKRVGTKENKARLVEGILLFCSKAFKTTRNKILSNHN